MNDDDTIYNIIVQPALCIVFNHAPYISPEAI